MGETVNACRILTEMLVGWKSSTRKVEKEIA
jgi:hypothetical protein